MTANGRGCAASVLGGFRDPRSVAALNEMLADEDPLVRENAQDWLETLNDPSFWTV